MTSQPFFIPSIIMLLLSLPMIFGLIPRQWAVGVRTRKTLENDQNWYSTNRLGGWLLLFSSLIYLVLAAKLPCLAPCGVNFLQWLVHLSGFALPLLGSGVAIFLYEKSL
jgi:hypothetical protein